MWSNPVFVQNFRPTMHFFLYQTIKQLCHRFFREVAWRGLFLTSSWKHHSETHELKANVTLESTKQLASFTAHADFCGSMAHWFFPWELQFRRQEFHKNWKESIFEPLLSCDRSNIVWRCAMGSRYIPIVVTWYFKRCAIIIGSS